jgi:hypothetical protein
MNFEYYWNNIPGIGRSRNNLIYTSLISKDKKTFVQWFFNDTNYHKDQNEIIDPQLMEQKWEREVCYLTAMSKNYPDLVPKIIDINIKDKKIYLEINGLDFWNRSGCLTENYDITLPNWQEQMLSIIQAHKDLGWYKFSMHPSSFFIVNGYLKSINYFFVYDHTEGPISISDHSSHIHSSRQQIMRKQVESLNISWNEKQPLDKLQHLCFESFRSNYPSEFIDQARSIYR